MTPTPFERLVIAAPRPVMASQPVLAKPSSFRKNLDRHAASRRLAMTTE